MKPRRVILTVEMVTGAPLSALKKYNFNEPIFDWKTGEYHSYSVKQIQVNVVQNERKPKQK